MRKILNTFWIIIIGSCSTPSDQEGVYIPENLDRREKIRYQQYLVEGAQLYKKYCSNCHSNNGKGIGKLYPPLAKADYLMEDIGRAACNIKNGLKGEIIVNGIDYNMEMPATQGLSAIEIAEILTYVTNSWGNKNGFVSVKDVNSYLKECNE
jgi:mono/diheme cytochrome c family protein